MEATNDPSFVILGRSYSSQIEWTVKEFAAKERVDERTVRRWIVKGAVQVRRTPGGRSIRIVERVDGCR